MISAWWLLLLLPFAGSLLVILLLIILAKGRGPQPDVHDLDAVYTRGRTDGYAQGWRDAAREATRRSSPDIQMLDRMWERS